MGHPRRIACWARESRRHARLGGGPAPDSVQLRAMTKAAVLKYLESEQDPRGIAHWEQHAEASGGLKSFGLGLTKLRKYAKQLGKGTRKTLRDVQDRAKGIQVEVASSLEQKAMGA